MIGDDDESDVPSLYDTVKLDAIVDGAAADSADSDHSGMQGLPRLLRYAMLAKEDVNDALANRLIAEIDELSPNLSQTTAWAAARTSATGFALAAKLDRLAVVHDLPALRSLSDCVRLLTLTLPCDPQRFGAYRRVARAMILAFRQIEASLDDERCCELGELSSVSPHCRRQSAQTTPPAHGRLFPALPIWANNRHVAGFAERSPEQRKASGARLNGMPKQLDRRMPYRLMPVLRTPPSANTSRPTTSSWHGSTRTSSRD